MDIWNQHHKKSTTIRFIFCVTIQWKLYIGVIARACSGWACEIHVDWQSTCIIWEAPGKDKKKIMPSWSLLFADELLCSLWRQWSLYLTPFEGNRSQIIFPYPLVPRNGWLITMKVSHGYPGFNCFNKAYLFQCKKKNRPSNTTKWSFSTHPPRGFLQFYR